MAGMFTTLIAVAALACAAGIQVHTLAGGATMTAARHSALVRLADDGTENQYPEQQEQQNEQGQQCNPNGCA